MNKNLRAGENGSNFATANEKGATPGRKQENIDKNATRQQERTVKGTSKEEAFSVGSESDS